MQVRATWVLAFWLLVLAACGGSEENDTEVAVTNNGTANIDAVVSDGETELQFQSIAANTTSNFQIATFGSWSELTVSVGAASSKVALTEGARNVVSVGADGAVTGVLVAVTPGSEGGGGW